MVITKTSKKVIGFSFFIIIVGLCTCIIFPQQVGKIAAISYVNNHYSNMSLKFQKMEYSPAHGEYFSVFSDNNGIVYNFLMSPKFFPIYVFYDPLNPQG